MKWPDTAKNPLVLGVGFAAFEMGSFLRYGSAAPGGGSNPLAGTITKASTVGGSQSAGIPSWLHLQRLQQDEAGRKVFDGAWPQIDGRMMVMSIRWGQPNNLMSLYMGGVDEHRSGGQTIRTWPVAFRRTACCTAARKTTRARRSWRPSLRRSLFEKFAASLCGFTCIEDIDYLPMSIGASRRVARMAVRGQFHLDFPATIAAPAGQSLPRVDSATHTNDALSLH